MHATHILQPHSCSLFISEKIYNKMSLCTVLSTEILVRGRQPTSLLSIIIILPSVWHIIIIIMATVWAVLWTGFVLWIHPIWHSTYRGEVQVWQQRLYLALRRPFPWLCQHLQEVVDHLILQGVLEQHVVGRVWEQVITSVGGGKNCSCDLHRSYLVDVNLCW